MTLGSWITRISHSKRTYYLFIIIWLIINLIQCRFTEFFHDEDWKQIRQWYPEIARKLKQLRIDRASAEEQNTVAQQINELQSDVASLRLLLTRLEQQFTRATQMKGIHP